MAKHDEIPQTNPDEIEALIKRLRQAEVEPQALDKQSIDRIERLLRFAMAVVNIVQRKNASIKRLRKMIFGSRTEKRQTENQPETAETETESNSGESASRSDCEELKASDGMPGGVEAKVERVETKAKRKGHGCKGAEEYLGAGQIECRNVGLKAETLARSLVAQAISTSVTGTIFCSSPASR